MNGMVERYQPEWKEDFERLNRAWIDKYFRLEPADIEVFQDPEAYILKGGGQIFFVLDQGVPVGTVGVKCLEDGSMELVKMAVEDAHQGKGLARELCEHALQFAKAAGVKKVVLYTNSLLLPALKLYASLGFVQVPQEEGLYDRADVKMEIRYA